MTTPLSSKPKCSAKFESAIGLSPTFVKQWKEYRLRHTGHELVHVYKHTPRGQKPGWVRQDPDQMDVKTRTTVKELICALTDVLSDASQVYEILKREMPAESRYYKVTHWIAKALYWERTHNGRDIFRD